MIQLFASIIGVINIVFNIKNECKMEEKYIEMVEDTFAYIDNNNCKRTYEEIIKLLNY